MGAQRHRPRTARHGLHVAVCRVRPSARPAVGQPAASGLARNFGQLIAARLGVGVGEATCSPASTSLIGDLFPTTSRARATAIWMLGLPLGLGLANGAGGWILQNWGWRNAFYVAAIPGVLCAIAALYIREPKRGTVE